MAIEELTLRLGADPTALSTGLRASSTAINSFSGKTRATFTRLGSSISSFADRAITPMTGLLLGGSMGLALKNVGDLSESLMYYGLSAKKSDKDTATLRKSLHEMAIQTGVDADLILEGISEIGEITGDFDFAEGMGSVLAKTSKAANTSIADLALLASAIKSNVGWGVQDITEYFNSLIIQGDAGSFTLKKFATEGKALFASASAFGVKTKDQFAYFGAILQTIAPSIRSEAEITTSVASLFRDLKDKQKELGLKGIKIFDIVDGKNQVRDLESIITEIMDKVKGDQKKLTELGLTSQSLKVLQPLMADYGKNWAQMKSISESGAKGMLNSDELDNRFKKASTSFNSNLSKMKASAVSFADSNLTGPIDSLSSSLQFLTEHQELVSAGFKTMAVAALALTAVKIGGFIGQIRGLAGDLTQIWSSKGKAASTSLPGAGASVQKVFVTNMSGGFNGGGDYYDDALPRAQTSGLPLSKASTEMGKFGKAISTTRSGVNKFGGTLAGGTLLTAASVWATGKIYEFGKTFIEWRNTVSAANAANREYIASSAKSFEAKYDNKQAQKWAKLYDNALTEFSEEGNKTFFTRSQSKLDQLALDMNKYRKLMANEIKNKNPENQSLVVDKSTVLPDQNIYISFDGSNAAVKTNTGKAPKVHSTKPFSGRV